MDFYVILGVGPNASTAEIKRAYRRLSRRYHPGVNPGDRTAEEAFTRIVQAYEVLMDPGRRQRYDAGERTEPSSAPGPQFMEFDFSVRAHGPQASTFSELFAEILHPTPTDDVRPETGADLHAALTIPFETQLTGDERQVMVTRQVQCAACGGAGRRQTAEARCLKCEGRGTTRWTRGHMVFSKPCITCDGTGRRRSDVCAVCAGHGLAVRSEALPVRVPPGIDDGTRLHLQGLGHAGRNGGAKGDLYVTVHVIPHPFFTRQGDDLHCTLPIAIHEAVLGARVDGPGLDGAFRRPAAIPGISSSRCGSCCRRRSTIDRRS